MKIAVTYDNGTIFQHFGKTEFFKIYEADETNTLTGFEVVSTNGQGHSALADFLADRKIDVLICGGIGAGAQNALADKGIEIYGGASGSADSAVITFLNGSLKKKAVSCNHHHDDGHSCGEHGCK